MRRLLLFISACILLGMTGCAPKSTNQKAEAPSWKAKHVILIGIDGWGAYSFPKAQIPHIRSLMAEGAYTLNKRSVLPSSSAVNWASMYMGAGPELHGYCEWGSQVPDLPSRVVNKDGIFPTIFSELRAVAPEAEIGNIYEWEGIRYLVDTLALSYDKHVVEVAQDRIKMEEIAARLQAEMTVAEKSTAGRAPYDQFADLAYMKIDPQTLRLLRDFAEERTDSPTLCIIGSSRCSRWTPRDLPG